MAGMPLRRARRQQQAPPQAVRPPGWRQMSEVEKLRHATGMTLDNVCVYLALWPLETTPELRGHQVNIMLKILSLATKAALHRGDPETVERFRATLAAAIERKRESEAERASVVSGKLDRA